MERERAEQKEWTELEQDRPKVWTDLERAG
jgi:hypothetical protein